MAPRADADIRELQLSFQRTDKPRPLDSETNFTKGLRYWHKIRLSAAFLPNEGAVFFEQLYMLPVLQALGTPVSLVTIPGCVSASVAMMTLPVCGRLSDGGSNPRRRKKAAVVCAVALMGLGMSLILLANAVHVWSQPPTPNHPSLHIDVNGTAAWEAIATGADVQAERSSDSSKTGLRVDIGTGAFQQTVNADSLRYALYEEPATVSVSSEATRQNSQQVDLLENPDVAASTLPLTLPPLALIAVLGFVLIDLGYDFTNVSLKTYVVSHSPRADHVSLLVLGVLVASFGGCCTAVIGLVDLGSLISGAPWAAQVCKQAIVQVIMLITLSVVCTSCSLLSAPEPSLVPVSLDSVAVTSPAAPPQAGSDADCQASGGPVVVMEHSTLTSDVQENVIMATASPTDVLGLSTSSQVDHPFAGHSISIRLHLYHDKPDHKGSTAVQHVKSYSSISPTKVTAISVVRKGSRRPSKATCNLLVLLGALFFTCCGTFSYTVTSVDFLGKVVFGGDPEDGYAKLELYEQGVKAGSLGLLITNLTYMVFSLVHHKVLTILGPKVEYLVVSFALFSLLLILWLNNALWTYYITASVIGLSRAVICTIPFMLANEQCQKEAEALADKGRHPRVGSFMGLVTCAQPCAWLVVSAITGPLMDATGDPAAPLLFSFVCVLFGGIIFSCHRS